MTMRVETKVLFAEVRNSPNTTVQLRCGTGVITSCGSPFYLAIDAHYN